MNDIDKDFEHLNTFDEKEVLLLPFTAFRVEKKKFHLKIILKKNNYH